MSNTETILVEHFVVQSTRNGDRSSKQGLEADDGAFREDSIKNRINLSKLRLRINRQPAKGAVDPFDVG
jgi:hypothetical protein